ncbi:DUF3291 domain-containing protein [Emticicia sp. BO119]|uniref:DUF3291 domain-containing protein n=1 Tax=Emticicia sp. BO119 TaxID=2757768 RepID=UPI0015F10F05|nr:DUF3291 domain-containing protein [Emticicia sp. BO119]MBA4849256.1 DUF3291 domain-containing protein [Emticicia sp. BO119]
MFVSLTIVRYPKYLIPIAILSMALFRLPLWFTKGITFWKLLGCGKNGSFDIQPDLTQWGLLGVWKTEEDFVTFQRNSLIQKWWKSFTKEQWTILCQPYESHGKWDGKEPFGKNIKDKTYNGKIAVLTRASIRVSKLKYFWSNVPQVANKLQSAPGFVTSVGIGEIPFIRQATFSIWESIDDVRQFAYRQQEHAEVIKRTRKEDWYSEELFARLIPLKIEGTLFGKPHLNNINATA